MHLVWLWEILHIMTRILVVGSQCAKKNSPKISDLTKRAVFQLNSSQSHEKNG